MQTHGDYPMYETPDNERITLPSEKKKSSNMINTKIAQAHTGEYEIDNRTICDVLDQICKDTDLYSYLKQQQSKRNGRRAYYTIHSRWFGANHVNMTASEAEMAL